LHRCHLRRADVWQWRKPSASRLPTLRILAHAHGLPDVWEDDAISINSFSHPTDKGVFGHVANAPAGGVAVDLIKDGTTVVGSGTIDAGGDYVINYVHKGKPATYALVIVNDAGTAVSAVSASFNLKTDPLVEVNYDGNSGGWAAPIPQ